MADTAGGTAMTQSTAGDIPSGERVKLTPKEKGDMWGGILGGIGEGVTTGLRKREEPTFSSAMLGSSIITGIPNGVVLIGAFLIIGGAVYASKG